VLPWRQRSADAGRAIEVLRLEKRQHVSYGQAALQHGPEHGFLGLDAVRWKRQVLVAFGLARFVANQIAVVFNHSDHQPF
jgi:hypothetical protein